VENEYSGPDIPMVRTGAKKISYFRIKMEHLFLQATRGEHVPQRNM
jgi:hypothetical protein